MDELDLSSIWARLIASIPTDKVPPQDRAWLPVTRPLGLFQDMALLAVPNEFAKNAIEARVTGLIEVSLTQQLGRPIRVRELFLRFLGLLGQ
jgi:chromosomal replication initiator protein